MKNNKNEVLIIQFIHPGYERTDVERLGTPCVIDGVSYDFIRRWGPEGEAHRRKFIVNPVDYIDGKNSVHDDKMRLWCEAEWDTLCRSIPGAASDILPKYEQIARNIPQDLCSGPGQHLNTDPYIFGDAFKYCCCQQRRNGRPSVLHDLPDGSIILFGSYKKVNGKDGFYLDTVFVVDRKLGEYSDGHEMSERIAKIEPEYQRRVSKLYRKRVLENLYPPSNGNAKDGDGGCLHDENGASSSNSEEACLEWDASSAKPGNMFSLYIGKVFDGNLDEPFSFVPVMPGNARYPRPLLVSLDDGNGNALITPNLTRGFKKTAIPRSRLGVVWKNLLKAMPKDYKCAWRIDE